MPEDLVRSNDHKDTPEAKGVKMEVWDAGQEDMKGNSGLWSKERI